MINFTGKVAVITGGANGIGFATARLFSALGASVVVADSDTSRRSMVETEEGGGIVFVETDTSSEASVAEMVHQVSCRFGGVDVLVNGAVRFVMRGLDASVIEWTNALMCNVVGYAIVALDIVPLMRRRGGGSIVNIASISAIIAQDNHLTYSTTKAAILGLTRCMAKELAPENIRVNAISPGTVWTDRTKHYIMSNFGLDKSAADRHPEMGGAHMLSRTADPIEIAQAIAFLASNISSFITAENLVVDGGCVAQ